VHRGAICGIQGELIGHRLGDCIYPPSKSGGPVTTGLTTLPTQGDLPGSCIKRAFEGDDIFASPTLSPVLREWSADIDGSGSPFKSGAPAHQLPVIHSHRGKQSLILTESTVFAPFPNNGYGTRCDVVLPQRETQTLVLDTHQDTTPQSLYQS